MCGKLLRFMLLVHAFSRCGGASQESKFVRVSNAINVKYLEISRRSVMGLVSCAALCSDGCWSLKYEENGSGSKTCDLYNLRDTKYTQLKFVNVADLYKKVYPPANAFVLIEIGISWIKARDFCQSQGGNLAIANSTAKMERLERMHSRTDTPLWIGGVTQIPPENGTIGMCPKFQSGLGVGVTSCGEIWYFVCEYQL
ncbi:uncharacterized protein LOC127848547 [Dreissena polymorpha]|uniref:C-type lectin domain-containing protein n=1 Tax=Dreissena polymorpha TaxID=45954 RepID=A0A9D4DSZ8_DREPO|nr:uncharacterized protein LOC127848547 [Dreissena polymorpha]KAH3753304.1 hypothetical protein DPMN_187939 [Dreissena polymorpha]